MDFHDLLLQKRLADMMKAAYNAGLEINDVKIVYLNISYPALCEVYIY